MQPEGIPLVDTVNNVQAILNNDQERAGFLAALDPSSEFPNWYSDIVEQMEQVSDPMIGFYEHQSKFDEAVQRHLVVPFAFPTNNDERLLLSSTLFMIQAGKCSFLLQRESTKGLLYVPYPILIQLELPLGDFLPSLTRYISCNDKTGRSFETVMDNVINTFAILSPQEGLQLGTICRRTASESQNLFKCKLKPFPRVSEVNNQAFGYFPYDPKTNVVCPQLHLLHDAAAGMYSLPKGNPYIDAIGLFDLVNQKAGIRRIVVFFQWKDWYEDKDMLQRWRDSQVFVKEHLETANTLNDPVNSLAFTFVLGSANPLKCLRNDDPQSVTESEPLLEREGIMDLSHMQRWFPTAGYNLQAAHKLRIIYSLDRRVRDKQD